MRVTVDRTRCQGHALCAMSAPELFDLDDVESHAFVLADPVPDRLAGAARSAAEGCPEQAVAVTVDSPLPVHDEQELS